MPSRGAVLGASDGAGASTADLARQSKYPGTGQLLLPNIGGWQAAASGVPTAQTVRGFRFEAPANLTVTGIAFFVGTALTAGITVDVGISDDTGVTILGSSGPNTGGGSFAQGLRTINLSASLALSKGTRYRALWLPGAGIAAGTIALSDFQASEFMRGIGTAVDASLTGTRAHGGGTLNANAGVWDTVSASGGPVLILV